MSIYLLVVMTFSYGLQYDHVEAFKTRKSCTNRGNHLEKGFYPNTKGKDIACTLTRVK